MQPRLADVRRWALLLVVAALTVSPPAAYARPALVTRLQGTGSVVIDPGHGGKDPGTHSRTHALEKDINLAIGTAVAADLRQQGVNAMLTRSSDIFVSLDERVAVSNSCQAKLFVSIHCDSSSHTSAKGFWVLIPHSFSDKASAAADAISRCLQSDGTPRHTIRRKERKLEVLNETHSPSVLVEVGFLSNPQEAANLANPAYQERLAATIADGIVQCLRNR
jgi:N-acetylmuramoyl-L-alanine amidase